MPSDPATTLASLLRQSTIDDHEELLKAANASLKASKGDVASQRTRVVALLKLDRFEDALRAIIDGGSQLQHLCGLEHAYALYKTGKLDEAANILRSPKDRAASHLAAQVAYRAERFEDALSMYSALAADSSAGDEESDLNINLLATAAQKTWQAADDTVPQNFLEPAALESFDTFETKYNLACGAIAAGEFHEASNLLQRACQLCDAADELGDEEKQLEMIPILVQRAYVYAQLGKHDEARQLHQQLSTYNIEDADTKVICSNNISALQDDGHNVFETQRRVATGTQNHLDAKLFEFQANSLRKNQFALALRAQKFPGVVRETRRLLEGRSWASSAEKPEFSAINVAARSLARSNVPSLKDVLAVIEERPADVGAVLTAVQLHVLANNSDAAINLLEALFEKLESQESLDTRFSPGLVALAVSLYSQQSRHACTKSELGKAVSHWIKQEGRQSRSLLKGAGIALLKSSDSADLDAAGAAFEKLCAQPTQDSVAKSGLVASFAKSDAVKVQPFLESLPAVQVLVSNVDTASLLKHGIVSAQPVTSLSKKRSVGDSTGTGQPNKRRRRRLQKNFEEGKKLDPERWLPLRDRSSYRPKGKKGKKKAAENTQGGFAREEETLELAGGAGSVKVEKAPTASSSNNKKKKKGKK